MTRILTAMIAGLLASPAVAHDAGGVFHLHPHGGEVVLVALAILAGVMAWFSVRR